MIGRQGQTVAFTVDVEPDCPPFLRGFRGIEQGMPRLLDLLASRGIAGTFFTTGDVASRYPEIVARLVNDGHELACHGMTHTAFPDLGEDAARDEIDRSAAILRHFAPVTSFRAPYLRFPSSYLPMLERAGFTLDSSQAIYKLAYHRERRAAASTPLARVPASVTSSVLRLPTAVRAAYLAALSNPVVLFVHPWEFVDLRREKLRLDCRFKTGDTALRCVAAVLDRYTARGARFVRMRDLATAT
ncbi:MAG TPA: polysaccharide deacetylase family protein [Gemmatimonadaceae bacterium]|nr:polysaccharide deacetylase family protein [Gemmatimonadaceae bacterium]